MIPRARRDCQLFNALRGRLSRRLALAPARIISYQYDAFDRKVAKHVDTDASGSIDTSEYYVYDGDDVLWDFVDSDGEQSGDPVIDKRYLHGPATDQILAEDDYTGGVLWYLADNLGTVRDLAEAATNGAGDVTDVVIDEHYSYDSFGNVLTGDTSKTRYLYTGREFDADTGLQYNRARWYDPATGNWLSEDPIGFTAGDTNLTRYVGNGVTNATDPTGLANWMTPSALPGSGISPEVDRQVERTKSAAAVNGFAQTVQSTFTLGFFSNVRIMSPTNDSHYGGMELSYRVAFEAMFGFGAGKLASAPGWIGKAAGLTNVTGDVTATGRGIANGDPVEGIAGAAGLGGTGLGRLASRKGIADDVCRVAEATDEVPVGTDVTRNWGGQSGPHGQSWTRDSVSSQTRESLGLGRSNTGEFVSHGTIVDNAGVTTRRARPWDGFRGGGDEVLIPDPQRQVRLKAVTTRGTPIPDGQ